MDDVYTASICHPSRLPNRVNFVHVRKTAIVLLLEFVGGSSGVRVPPPPKLLNKLLSFFIGTQIFKHGSLFIGDDVHHIFIQPFFEIVLLLFLNELLILLQ
jgi:hypothetical protein